MFMGRYIRSISIAFLLLGVFLLASPSESHAQIAVGISVSFGPPELPVYEQSICPAEGYIWTPGYWAWDEDDQDYYWVPGTWVVAPEVGFLWTPGYWAWGGNGFFFHEGYWGPVVGFYGGINYGFGYFGHGYEGGHWDHDHFFYNRTVNNINVTEIHNVYNTNVVINNRTRVSYNGGNGGLNERASREEEAAARERHIPPVSAQMQHVQAARADRSLRASENHGKPPVAATPRPGAFNDRGIVAAREGGRYNPPPKSENRASRTTTSVSPAGGSDRPPNRAYHPNELPPIDRRPVPNTGNAKVDQKYQQQQDKLRAQQDRDRQKLQQKQEQDHQRLAQQQANEAKKQQTEQRHQQQTEQLQQKHVQQQQKLEQHQQPHSNPPSKGKH